MSMTAGELVRRLQAFDPELPIVTNGFDGYGLEDIDTVVKVRHIRDVNTGHVGTHDFPKSKDDEARVLPAVYIGWSLISEEKQWPK